MTVTNGRNLAGFAALINDSGKVIAEAFSTDLAAATRPTIYDSDGDVPFDAPKGSQAYVASEGLLLKLTDAAWYVLDGSDPGPPPWTYGGAISGFVAGSSTVSRTAIDKFSFVSDENAVNSGITLTAGRSGGAGVQNSTTAYHSGGAIWPGTTVPRGDIDKYEFVSAGSATNIGDLERPRWGLGAHSNETAGWTSGGSERNGALPLLNTIESMPFATETSAVTTSTLSAIRMHVGGASTADYGYTLAGLPPNQSSTNAINRFSFVNSGSAINVGYLANQGHAQSAAVSSSSTHAYGASLSFPQQGTGYGIIQKVQFAAETSGVNIGNLSFARYWLTQNSSKTAAYISGGNTAGGPSNVIDKVPFAVDGTATDVGDLTAGVWQATSNDY